MAKHGHKYFGDFPMLFRWFSPISLYCARQGVPGWTRSRTNGAKFSQAELCVDGEAWQSDVEAWHTQRAHTPMNFLWCSYDFPMICLWFSYTRFSYDFPMMFPWFPYIVPFIFLWFSYDFRMIFRWLSDVFPMISLWFFYDLLWFPLNRVAQLKPPDW